MLLSSLQTFIFANERKVGIENNATYKALYFYTAFFIYGKTRINEKAIAEAEELNLRNNHFYFTLVGEIYKGIDSNKAKTTFEKAIFLAKSKADKDLIKINLHRYKFALFNRILHQVILIKYSAPGNAIF